jgi:hypothetical protein
MDGPDGHPRSSIQPRLFIYLFICLFICLFIYLFVCLFVYLPIPVAARCKAWVCGRSLAGIVGSNPVGGMDLCLL